MTKYAGRVARLLLENQKIESIIANLFHVTYYYSHETWRKNTWLGYPIQQCPLDIFIVSGVNISHKTVVYPSNRNRRRRFFAFLREYIGHNKCFGGGDRDRYRH